MPWLPTCACDPPHGISHPLKLAELEDHFLEHGWDLQAPALVGYIFNGRVQLLSGSHRWAAAVRADLRIPVVIRPLEEVQAAWGNLPAWSVLMTAPPAGEIR
jgi:ParB-like chromosome segregation protein Spo0J